MKHPLRFLGAAEPPVLRVVLGMGTAMLAPSLATLVIVEVNQHIRAPNESLVYLPVVLLIAVYFGTASSLVAAVVSAMEYDFFLLHPLLTFSISQAADVLSFIIFVGVALLTSQLAARAREREGAAQRRATENAMLYELAQALMSARDVPHILDAVTRQIVSVFDVDGCSIYVPDSDGRLHCAAQTARSPEHARTSDAAAAYVFRRGTEIGLPPGDFASREERRVFVPLRTADSVGGVMEIGPKRSGRALDAEERRLVASFAAQASLVLVQARREEERERLALLEESDRLKSNLLSAVSHDLRTPLASIKASATSLLLRDVEWSAEDGQEFVRAINEEADRLNRLVGNLLDLSRIEAGALRPVLDWYDVDEIVRVVMQRLRPLVTGHPIVVDIEPALPCVRVDAVRIEELLINLLENAIRYGPPGDDIALRVWKSESNLHISVADHGPGVPRAERARIFDRFYRLQQRGDRDRGTGLGLAICQGIADIHGGAIRVEETPGGGATFVLDLPGAAIFQAAPA